MNYENVTQVEVIDENGQSYIKYGIVGMTFELQDDGRILKLYLTNEKKQEADKLNKLRKIMELRKEIYEFNRDFESYDAYVKAQFELKRLTNKWMN